ncbi:hypothetical protein DCAR_0415176 [Daucus carota subsp. sativus]|uniref:Uncharacterized protein n=1 Tax=Daucus carota subsp. sativus TaxID=79200 RepID=A0A165A843_DAUCS|nr:hypothetical protein DCAR_0415176 [Daucus carota subsp. sativus]
MPRVVTFLNPLLLNSPPAIGPHFTTGISLEILRSYQAYNAMDSSSTNVSSQPQPQPSADAAVDPFWLRLFRTLVIVSPVSNNQDYGGVLRVFTDSRLLRVSTD